MPSSPIGLVCPSPSRRIPKAFGCPYLRDRNFGAFVDVHPPSHPFHRCCLHSNFPTGNPSPTPRENYSKHNKIGANYHHWQLQLLQLYHRPTLRASARRPLLISFLFILAQHHHHLHLIHTHPQLQQQQQQGERERRVVECIGVSPVACLLRSYSLDNPAIPAS